MRTGTWELEASWAMAFCKQPTSKYASGLIGVHMLLLPRAQRLGYAASTTQQSNVAAVAHVVALAACASEICSGMHTTEAPETRHPYEHSPFCTSELDGRSPASAGTQRTLAGSNVNAKAATHEERTGGWRKQPALHPPMSHLGPLPKVLHCDGDGVGAAVTVVPLAHDGEGVPLPAADGGDHQEQVLHCALGELLHGRPTQTP
jgi:hypothetical protein